MTVQPGKPKPPPLSRRNVLRRSVAAALAAGTVPLGTAVAQGSDKYPSKPIRIVVGFAPGGGTDIVARIVAQGMTEQFGQSAVVDNRPGGGGNIASELVARSAPDGYTLIARGTGSHAINQSLFPNLTFDPVKDFTPVCLVASTPYLLVLSPSVPANSVRELVEMAKAAPGTINMASAGNGSMGHLGGELFKMMTGLKAGDMKHIPYKGTGSLFPDLISGRVHVFIGDVIATYPLVKSGKLRVLGVTSLNRAPRLPDIPTVSEAGVPGYEAIGWFGMFAPAQTPRPIINTLHNAIMTHVLQPGTRERLAELGADVNARTAEEFARIQEADALRWAKVVKASGARIE